MPEAGTPVGRYVIIDRIGQGGMGMVFAAHDPELDRRVAIKLLRASADGSAPEAGQGQLLREAQAMAKLSHPNVLPIYDVGTYEDGVFLAMQLVEGTTVRQWLQAEERPWRQTHRVFVAAARGLRAAHRAGLVHGDFKPDNVLIGRGGGGVRVGDFGLARSVRNRSLALEGSSAPGSGEIAGGTPGYLAPELRRGQPTSRASDQFAYCVSFYEALHGCRPVPGRDSEAPPGRMDRGVPRWLDRILLRGSSPDPVDRFPGMQAVILALRGPPRMVSGRRK
jgi:serine/threonine protein kinase